MNDESVKFELTEPQIKILKAVAAVEKFDLFCLSHDRPRPGPLKGMPQGRLGLEVRRLTELNLCRTDEHHNVCINEPGLAWIEANIPLND